MAKQRVKRVACSTCRKPKFVSLPVPVPFVCKECRAKAAPRTMPAPKAPQRDPWYRDLRKNSDGSLKGAAGDGTRWIEPRKDWLRR